MTLADALPWALVAAAAAGLLYQQRILRQFLRWAGKPLRKPHIRHQALQAASNDLRKSLKRARRRTHEALQKTSHFRNVTAALPDAAVLVDSEGRIENFNDASTALLRLKRKHKGADLGALLRHPDAVSLMQQQTPDETVEIGSPYMEGQRLELRRIRVGERQDLILVRDVTHLNRLLTMRQDFIANVSHELRTPLTVVIGYLEAMDEGEALDEQALRSLVHRLRSPARRMHALVDDLLMLTRLEASPNPEPRDLSEIDMRVLLDNVVEDASGLTTGGHRIRQQVEPALKALAVEKELLSACGNLITNAIKYSPEGGDIDICWRQDGKGALFEVRDQGMGIAPEHLSRLTERFYRVDLARARVKGGTGLGLAIVKHVLKRHGARLQIESEVGQGSRFFFRLRSQQVRLTRPSLAG